MQFSWKMPQPTEVELLRIFLLGSSNPQIRIKNLNLEHIEHISKDLFLQGSFKKTKLHFLEYFSKDLRSPRIFKNIF